MKLKKVEISGFRIYDDPKDATFDLTAENGAPAGFVSLYAPNGFGKTSFYDAVEYAMTESIDRFYIRAEELEKLASAQSFDKFIRNTGTQRDTYVKILTDETDKPEIYTPFYKHGNQRHDLKLGTFKPKQHAFQKVILSQEWISAFLTESKGDVRYQKFMSNPELSGVNNYYNNLKHLLKALDGRKNRFQELIAENEPTAQLPVSGDLLETINKQIKLLAEKFQTLSFAPVTLNTSQEDIKMMQDQIADLVISGNVEAELKSLLERIETLTSGNESIISLSVYYSLSEEKIANTKRINFLADQLRSFKEIDQLTISLEHKKSTIGEETKKHEVLKDIVGQIDGYLEVKNTIALKRQEVETADQQKKEMTSNVAEIGRKILEFRELEEGWKSLVEDLSQKKSEFPAIGERLTAITSQLAALDGTIAALKTSIESSKLEEQQLARAIHEFEQAIVGIERNVFPVIIETENGELFQLINKLQEEQALITGKRKEIDAVDTTFSETQKLHQSISDFIRMGLEIVSEKNDATCPLCENKFDSYQELVDKITANKALDDSLKLLLEKKTALDAELKQLSDSIAENKEKLINVYEQKLGSSNQLLTELQVTSAGKEELFKNESNLKVQLQQEEAELKLIFSDASQEEYELNLTKKIEEAQQKRRDNKERIDKNQLQVSENENKINTAEQQIALINKEIDSLMQNSAYKHVTDWFTVNFPQIDIKKNWLLDFQAQRDQQLLNFNRELREIEVKIADAQAKLTSFTQQSVDDEKNKLNQSIESIDTRLERYKNFVRDVLEIVILEQSKDKLAAQIETRKKKALLDLESNKLLVAELQKLDKYGQNIWVFLQSENAKIRISEAKEELALLQNDVGPLIQKEFDEAQSYLESEIKKFFHVELINEIYRKIDPHPDFKSVQFKATFTDDSPRLDVFVKKTDDTKLLVPNLYFSTAQINILSLSIFLATALNEQKYKCIFIDDPIQSMDNINILSTIDLIRSIVVNYDRQVILSTHDENFYNLLKKKMPAKFFSSRFLELESFGKVKAGNG